MRRNQNEGTGLALKTPHVYCGGCDNGWREGENGWYPCQCNKGSIAFLKKLEESKPAVSIEDVELAMERNRIALTDCAPAFDRARGGIRQILKKADDGAMMKKKEYWATIHLARKLHDPKGENWGISEWEKFNESHEDPFGELEELEGSDVVNRAFRESLPVADVSDR